MLPIPTAPLPDALQIPDRYKRGGSLAERINSIADIADPLLGVDESRGERSQIKKQRGFSFVTKDPADTLYFPTNTPLRGSPRYHWIDRPDGIRLGYLTPEAREMIAPAFDPVALGLAHGLPNF